MKSTLTVVLLLGLGLASSLPAQNWQRVYPPSPQTGQWSAIAKVPGGSWLIAGDGQVLRSTDLSTFTTEINTPNVNWRGAAVRRFGTNSYTLLFTGGSTLAVTDTKLPGGYDFRTLPFGITGARGIACSTLVDGGCVVAAGSSILYGNYDNFFERSANTSNHNVNFTNGRLFVTGYGGGVSSWDGAQWLDSSASFADVYNVAFGPDGAGGQHYVTVGDAGAIAVSSSLSQWTTSQPLGLFYAKTVIYAEDRYLAVGQYLPDPTTWFIESLDGLAWSTAGTLSNDSSIVDLQFIDGTYVAVGAGREIWVRRAEDLFANGFE